MQSPTLIPVCTINYAGQAIKDFAKATKQLTANDELIAGLIIFDSHVVGVDRMRLSREGPADAKMRALVEALQVKARELFSEPVKFYYRQMTLSGEELPHRTVVALSFGGPAEEHELNSFREVVRAHYAKMKPQAEIPVLADFVDPFIPGRSFRPHGIKFVVFSKGPITVMKQFEGEHFISTTRIE